MEIKRDLYLKQLTERKQNGLIKVITGIRRCGKSYLLNTLFYNELRLRGFSVDVGVIHTRERRSQTVGSRFCMQSRL